MEPDSWQATNRLKMQVVLHYSMIEDNMLLHVAVLR